MLAITSKDQGLRQKNDLRPVIFEGEWFPKVHFEAKTFA
jgi:hypothetical protein